MATLKDSELRLIELSAQIQVRTNLEATCIPALRSGFAGYPINPRWNAAKLRAWRLGCQWRRELAAGERVVRDSLLVEREALARPTPSEAIAYPFPQPWIALWWRSLTAIPCCRVLATALGR